MRSDYERERYDYWWSGKGGHHIMPSNIFNRIKTGIASGRIVDIQQQHQTWSKGKFVAYETRADNEIGLALGWVYVFFDRHGNITGVTDVYDFNKLEGKYLGAFGSGLGAKPYLITAGEYECPTLIQDPDYQMCNF